MNKSAARSSQSQCTKTDLGIPQIPNLAIDQSSKQRRGYQKYKTKHRNVEKIYI